MKKMSSSSNKEDSSCNKLNIPFVRQEISMDPSSNRIYPLGKLDLSYNDPTTLLVQRFKNTSIMELRSNGKIAIDISGDICNYNNQIKTKGIMSFEKIISGPYRTEGGIIQFQRLYLRFEQLKIPIHLSYNYDPQKICDVSSNLDLSGALQIKLDDSSENKIGFDKFFVTNSLFESNRNEIFSSFGEQFKNINGTFKGVFENFLSTLKNTEIFVLVVTELNRILCLSKKEGGSQGGNTKEIKVSEKDTDILPMIRYKEKIARLKEKGFLDLIFK
jgi:hypothetical protein